MVISCPTSLERNMCYLFFPVQTYHGFAAPLLTHVNQAVIYVRILHASPYNTFSYWGFCQFALRK